MMSRRNSVLLVTLPILLAACDSRPVAPEWLRITQTEPCNEPGCDRPAFYLDTANISVTGGTPYVILQTRYGDGRVGSVRAEANCPRSKLEPTALKEAIRQADGSFAPERMLTMSADDERAVLQHACARR